MIKIQAIGNLGRDAETKQMQDGSTMIRFSVGVSQGKDKATQWISCVMFRNAGQSTSLAQYLTKGQKVYIDGLPSTEVYNGAAYLNCRVGQIELVGSKQEAQQAQQAPPAPATQPANDEPLPF